MNRSLRVIAMVFLFASAAVAAEEEYNFDPEEQARKSHELAMSDVIYEQENFKALYYQNQAILQVLKEIRDEIQRINARAAKSGQPSQEAP